MPSVVFVLSDELGSIYGCSALFLKNRRNYPSMQQYLRRCVFFIILVICIVSQVFIVSAHANPKEKYSSLIRRAANAILKHQASDGAITMGIVQTPPAENDISPYCGNLGAIGLVSAYKALHDMRYVKGAERWAIWYEDHINPDGVMEDYRGNPGSWKATGHYDSTDSYASTWLDLVQKIYEAGAGLEWLNARWNNTVKIAHAMELTRQVNGLTWATPKWPVMYTMDNVETRRGIEATIKIAGELGHSRFAANEKEWHAQNVQIFEKTLWNAAMKRYEVGLQANGSIVPFKGEWYPSVMANMMVIAWAPVDARNRSLYANIRGADGLPVKCESGEDMKTISFWLMAANRMNARKDMAQLTALLDEAQGAIWDGQYPDVLGFICRGAGLL
jgi:hypothetical protein